ncbi:M48 family metalloprotease [Halosimplex salinum]|uniref:M48 family metalloprotease n=1 Tax=Halosimplex salinum TaxID=1710538 RepID=UPI000F479548|nr:M48 family metalloprotease [Halosimplex salinum]
MPALQPHLRRIDASGSTPVQSGVNAGALVDSLGVLAAASVVGALAFSLYGRYLLRADDRRAALSRLRRALRVGLTVVYAVTVVGMLVSDWATVVAAAIDPVLGAATQVGDAVTLTLTIATPLVAVFASYFGAFPAAQALRETDVSAVAAAARLARYAAGMTLLFVVLVVALDGLRDSPAVAFPFFALVGAVVLAVWVASPWLVRVLQSTRSPTAAERDRLDRLREDVELNVRGVRVLETADAKQAFAFARGVPGRRHLFVSDYLLAELDDDRLRAYLALKAGRLETRHLEARLAVVAGALSILVALFTGSVSVPGVGAGAAALVVVAAAAVALWAGQRLVYRADAAAVQRTSRDAVEAAIRRYADLNDAPLERGRVAALRRMEPSLSDRIDRLRDRASRE